MKMSKTPENGDGEQNTTGLFPLFPTQANSVSAISTAPQWLRNASFTTDLSVIDAAASTAPSLSDVEASEEEEEGDAYRNNTEANQPRVYDLIEEEEGSESDDDDKAKKKRDKKKKRKKDSDEYYTKPAKDYYLDTRPDPDNLAYGSIYRMNVPRYKLDNSQRGPESGSTKLYLRNRRGSMLDAEIDVNSLDGKAKSDNRYWYAKNAAMERNKNFRRIRLSASRDAVDSSFDRFIPLEEGEAVQESEEEDVESKQSVVGTSWEDEVLNKTREFNRQTRERPHDEKAWLAFADFQDKVSSMQSQKGVRLQTLEKKISILEKAFELNPDSEELLLALLKAYRSRDSADVLISRWEKALMQNSSSYKLWREFLRVVQGEFSRFKVSEVRKMYSYAIQALFSACSKRHRQMDATSEPLDSTLIQQELVLVDMLVSLCRFEWQAGYRELATALFQAEMEYSIFSPSLLLSEQSKLRLFEHFWSSNGARDLLLCGVYAQREAASGNMKHARRIFDMALTSICGLPKELQDNSPLLYLWYAESEVANSSGGGLETESSSRAMHILCYLGSGLAYVPYTSQPSSMQILRARQGFREKLKKIQSIWSHGVTDDQSVALVCSAALFEELTNDLSGTVEILEHMFSSVLPGRRSQSHQLEILFNYYVRMLQRHQDDVTLSKLWKPISDGMQLYPFNPELYRALVDICNHRMTSHKLRMMFDDYSRK
ncbi:hypothetical protein F2Q70_00023217 [Brassica cretica]|uniref:Uncharacterized protein n=1 Tax=Brassica cretica TaxID=69181 RepID=A0A8S9GVX4_BRACR|nr:hypothetical protein F2Q70_00023217 [Brassica cretica]